jgi:hypothetical protein
VNKRILAIILLVLAIIAGVVLTIMSLFGNKQKLTIEISEQTPNVAVSVFAEEKQDGGAVLTTSTNEEAKLKKGVYVVQGRGDGYQEQSVTVDLSEGPQSVFIEPSYSKEKLDTMLEEEQAAINKALFSKTPELKSKKWRIYPGKLYKQGQWYGTVTTKQATDEQRRLSYYDVYRVALQKKDQKWQVINEYPKLLLTSPAYPNVPHDVLVDINSRAD